MLTKEQAQAAADAVLAQHTMQPRRRPPDLTGLGFGVAIGGTVGLVATAVQGVSYPVVALAIGGGVVAYGAVRLARRVARSKSPTPQ